MRHFARPFVVIRLRRRVPLAIIREMRKRLSVAAPIVNSNPTARHERRKPMHVHSKPTDERRLPQGAVTLENAFLEKALAPALAELRRAANGAEAMVILDQLPAHIRVPVVIEMGRKALMFRPEVMTTALRLTGFQAVARAEGSVWASAIFKRFGALDLAA